MLPKKMAESKDSKIAIVGSGLIGRIWSMIFAGAGYHVTIYDIQSEQVAGALASIRETLGVYEKEGSLRGKLSADQQADFVTGSSDLAQCLQGAKHVQECVPEDLNLKRKVFEQLDHHATPAMVLATSSSCLLASQFADKLKHRANVLVAHPVNPPYFLPLVELVPAPFTSPEVVQRTRDLMTEIGQSPITLQKEVPGFAVNRIQYAIINECWDMVKNGVLSPSDIDKVMKDGLGPRYAFIGPLETMHLNANGVVDYCSRYAEGAYKVCQTFTPPPVMYDADTARTVEQDLARDIPIDTLAERRKWRDERLAALAKLKKN